MASASVKASLIPAPIINLEPLLKNNSSIKAHTQWCAEAINKFPYDIRSQYMSSSSYVKPLLAARSSWQQQQTCVSLFLCVLFKPLKTLHLYCTGRARKTFRVCASFIVAKMMYWWSLCAQQYCGIQSNVQTGRRRQCRLLLHAVEFWTETPVWCWVFGLKRERTV